MPDPAIFLDWRVFVYVLGVIAIQVFCWCYFSRKRKSIAKARADQGLPADVLLNNSVRLEEARYESLVYAAALLLSVFLLPLLLIWFDWPNSNAGDTSLGLTFLILLFWVFFSCTDVSKAYLGGLAFKTLAAFKVPFQVGDRAAFQGVEGKVVSVDTFFTILQTQNDDKISVPTASLWNSVVTSVNGSSQSSLCVMNFYLSSQVSKGQRQAAEDKIWDAIQVSTYFDAIQPMQIFLTQQPDCIRLTAKAYVASTYREPQFSSDVTTAFLDYASEEGILPVADIKIS